MKRTILMIVLACALPLRAGTDEPVKIVAESLPSPTAGDVTSMSARAVLKEFLARNPDIRVEPFAMPAIEGSSMDSGPLLAIAAGIPPHVIRVNFRQSSTYLQQGFLDPLEVLLARNLSTDERTRQTDEHGRWLADPSPGEVARAIELIHKRVPKPAWPVIYRKDEKTKETHAYAVPLSNLVMALLYRKDLFAEAGLDPERPPKNWEEFLDAARKITQPEKQHFGFMLTGSGQYMSWGIYNFSGSNGVEAVKQDASGRWYAAYGTREMAETILFVRRLLHEPFTPPGSSKTVDSCTYISGGVDGTLKWQRGEIGMFFTSIREELISQLDPELIGIAPVPAAPSGASRGQVNAESFGVFTQSTPAQKLAAMRYIWFITGDDAKRIRTDVYVKNGVGKFVSPDLLEKFGYERQLRQVSKGWQETFRTSIENGVPEPYGKNTQNIYRWMSEPINTSLEKPDLDKLDREAALTWIQGELEKSCKLVNQEVMGDIPPQTMRMRRMVAIPVLAIMTFAFGFGLVNVWRSFAKMSAPFTAKAHWRKHVWGYVLLVPALGLIAWWAYIPLGIGLSLSFFDYQLVRDSLWVGIDNFANVLFDDKFWYPLFRTFYFVAITIGLGFWPPILLAILLQEIPTATAKYVFRTIFYLPAVVSGLVVMFLWKQMYNPSDAGILNQLLMSFNTLGPASATIVKLVLLGIWLSLIVLLIYLPIKVDEMSGGMKLAMWASGLALLALTIYPLFTADAGATLKGLVGAFSIKPLKWAADPSLAMLCVVLPHVWAASGPGCILYLAALKSVPDEYYEAADIDGASNWHKVFYIVLPFLKYLIVVQFIGAVIGAFKGGVEMIMVMTGGGPNNATSILALEIFNRVFLDLRFGTGTAMAWMLGALLIGFTAYQLKMLSRAEFRAAGATTK